MYRDGMMLTGLAVTIHGSGHNFSDAWEYAVAAIALILIVLVRTYEGKGGSGRRAGRWSWRWPARNAGPAPEDGENLDQRPPRGPRTP
jgi:hypothetical protein